MSKALYIAPFAIFAITILIVVFSLVPRVDRYLTIKSIETCGNITKYTQENTDKGFTVAYPAPELYKTCLTQTGTK